MKFIMTMLVLSLLMSCSHFSEHFIGERLPASSNSDSSDESIFKILLPFSVMKHEVKELAKDNEFIEGVDYFSMDPYTRMLSLRLRVKYPLDSLLNMGDVKAKKFSQIQTIDLALSFPPMKQIALTSYLSLQFHRFRINGDDYLAAFPIVASVVQTILANTSLINYIYDMGTKDISDVDTKSIIKSMLEKQEIKVSQATNKIYFKLNLKHFKDLERFGVLQDLRLWSFAPRLLAGTEDVVFRLEAGVGKPSQDWQITHNAQVEKEKEILEGAREELYAKYSRSEAVKDKLNSYFEQVLKNEKLIYAKLPLNYRNEVDKAKSDFLSRASSRLNKSNPNFTAAPEYEYLLFLEEEKEIINTFVVDMDRRLVADSKIKAGGSKSNRSLPLVEMWIGQDVLNGSMNFVRDYEFEKQNFIKDAKLVLLPQNRGIVLKGSINVDMNYLLGYMDSGFADKKIISKMPETAEGAPFEIWLETRFHDDSWFALDVRKISFFEKERQLSFNANSRTQAFFMDFLKMYLAQSLAALEFDMGGESPSEEELLKKQIEDNKRLAAYLKELQKAYGEAGGDSYFRKLAKVMTTDLEKNPFITEGIEYLESTTKLLFSDLIKYDEATQLFMLKVDPKIVIDTIDGAQNTLQVWNIEPIYSEEFHNTFLELAVGNGMRGRNYVEKIEVRRNDPANAGFAGLYKDNDRSQVDLLASLDFKHLENFANKLFQDMVIANNGNYEQMLKKDEEQSYYIIDSIKFNIEGMDKISIDLNASELVKKKKGLVKKKWVVEKNSYGLSAALSLSSGFVKDMILKKKGKLPFPVAEDAQVLALSPISVKIKFGKKSLIDRALNGLANINFEGGIGTKLKKLLLIIVDKYFNSFYKEKENSEALWGSFIESYAKIVAGKDDLYVILNPRLSGSAFELKLAGTDQFLNRSLVMDEANKRMQVALTAAVNMAKLDKRHLLELANDALSFQQELFKINNKKEFVSYARKLQLVSKMILNSDASKRSFYNQLINIMTSYDAVLNTVDLPNKSENSMARLTSTGTELMYFAGTSYVLLDAINLVISRIAGWSLEDDIQYYNSLKEAANKLEYNIFLPLMKKYRSSFHEYNQFIKESEPSYWTYPFLPDSLVAEGIYDVLQSKYGKF